MTLSELSVEERIQAAWRVYAEETASLPEHDYDALEPFAYRRLKRTLAEIRRTVEFTGK